MLLSAIHYLHYFLCNVFNGIERPLDKVVIYLTKRYLRFFFKKQEYDKRIQRQKESIERGWQHRDDGRAGGVFVGIISFFVSSILMCVSYLLEIKTNFIYILVLSFCVTWVMTHFLVFRKDRFNNYFKRFDKLDKAKRIFYNVLCLFFILLVFQFMLFGWRLMQ